MQTELSDQELIAAILKKDASVGELCDSLHMKFWTIYERLMHTHRFAAGRIPGGTTKENEPRQEFGFVALE